MVESALIHHAKFRLIVFQVAVKAVSVQKVMNLKNAFQRMIVPLAAVDQVIVRKVHRENRACEMKIVLKMEMRALKVVA